MSSPAMKARVAGAFYAAVVVTSLVGFMAPAAEPFHRLGLASNLLSASATIVVTVLLYEIFKPVDSSAALLMAAFNLVGVAHSENSLAFFGCYCVLLGYLIYKSGFMPKAVGVVMVLAGIGLLTNGYLRFFMPSLAHVVRPYAFVLDTGEIVFTLWLLIFGVNEQKWRAKAAHLMAV